MTIKENFELELIRNAALGSAALAAFTISYFAASKKVYGPQLPMMYLVLPLSFHIPTAKIMAATNRQSGLLKVFEKDSALAVGLQNRI